MTLHLISLMTLLLFSWEKLLRKESKKQAFSQCINLKLAVTKDSAEAANPKRIFTVGIRYYLGKNTAQKKILNYWNPKSFLKYHCVISHYVHISKRTVSETNFYISQWPRQLGCKPLCIWIGVTQFLSMISYIVRYRLLLARKFFIGRIIWFWQFWVL